MMYSGTSDSGGESEFEDLTALGSGAVVTKERDETQKEILKHVGFGETDTERQGAGEGEEDEEEDDIDAKGLFGDESEEEDEELPSLFGDGLHKGKRELDARGTKESAPEPPEVVEYCDIPQLDPKCKNYLVDMPNILFVEPKPFDPDLYESVDPQKVEDHSLRMMVENTIRWRYEQGADGQLSVQSNARFIEWSDGRRSLLVGDELLDVTVAPTPPYQYLVSIHHEDNLLMVQDALREKMMFKPYGVTNKTHQKMASMLARKFKRHQRTKLINLDKNLEQERKQQILAEQEVLKAQRRLEAKTRSLKARYASSEDMEEDAVADRLDDDDIDDNDEGGAGSGDKKSSWRKGRIRSPSHPGAEEDDLDDFIVEDDEEPQRYDEADELEELERAEQFLSARKVAGDENLERSTPRQRKGASTSPVDMERRFSPPRAEEGKKQSTLITIDDDDTENNDSMEVFHIRKGKKRAVVSDDEEQSEF